MPGENNISLDLLSKIFNGNINISPKYNDLKLLNDSVNSVIKDIEAFIKFSDIETTKNFTYDADDNITEQTIIGSDGVTRLFLITYGYTGGDLTEIIVLRDSDGFTYTKTLTYDINGNLESITTTI